MYGFGKFTVVFLLRYWAVKHLQNIGRISCACHFGVYTCDYTCSIGNNSGALLYIISADISSIENIFCGTSASLDREVTRFVFMLFALFYTHTHIDEGGSGRSSLSGFPRNEVNMGAEFRGKNRLNCCARAPLFYVCSSFNIPFGDENASVVPMQATRIRDHLIQKATRIRNQVIWV